MNYDVQKLLFVELLGGIGDVLIALSAIQALGRSYMGAELTVLTFSPGGELLVSDPLIQSIIYAEHGNARRSIEVLLAEQPFDLIVSDTNYDGIAELIQSSAAQRSVTNLWRSPPSNQQVSDRFLEILLMEGLITPDVIQPPQLYLTASEHHIAQQLYGLVRRPLIFLCPDAGMQIKRWSEVNFVTLGQSLQQQYGATVIVPVGSDLELSVKIAEAIGKSARILPRGKLRHLAATLACADLVVAADTGLARIAAVMGVPTITLFGPSWYGRYGQPLPHLNLQGYPECSERAIHNFTEQYCWYSGICPLEQNWQSCMEAISPSEVLAAAEKLLTKDHKE
ncbi:MAG: glycosyltransferase family 9 protein [Chroococcidiopsidaceae cyanobacterium CP_BM_ER_R8_30]|nr:glycosyltransferase family 9 protein [Chroococcidiopsidaceae cyanobacterium CP_BM_ER_R8_30]